MSEKKTLCLLIIFIIYFAWFAHFTINVKFRAETGDVRIEMAVLLQIANELRHV